MPQVVRIQVKVKSSNFVAFTQYVLDGSEVDVVHGIIAGANLHVANGIREIVITYPDNEDR